MTCSNQKGYFKTVNGKVYGPYHYDRSTHEFTTKDVARIARYVSRKDGITAAEVLVAVAAALGFATLFCKTAKALEAALSLSTFIKQLSAVLAFGQLTTTIIQFLLAAKLVSPNWLKIILALIIAALVFINKLLEALEEMADSRTTILEVSSTINGLCDKARELAGLAVEKTCDAVSRDACYAAERKAEEIAWFFKSDAEKLNAIMNETWMDRLINLIRDNLHDSDWTTGTN